MAKAPDSSSDRFPNLSDFFDFLALSGELRNRIYDFCLRPPPQTQIEVADQHKTNIGLEISKIAQKSSSGHCDVSKTLNVALLSTCRQIKFEATPVLYDTEFVFPTTFAFDLFRYRTKANNYLLKRLVIQLPGSPRIARLSKLLQSLTHMRELTLVLDSDPSVWRHKPSVEGLVAGLEFAKWGGEWIKEFGASHEDKFAVLKVLVIRSGIPNFRGGKAYEAEVKEAIRTMIRENLL